MGYIEGKTVGIFLHALHYGGIEKFVETHCGVYNPRINDCHIIVNRVGDKNQEEHFERLGFKLHRIQMSSPKSISVSAISRHRELFDNIEFDVVHSNLATNILPMKYAKKYHVPVKVLHSHSDYLTSIGTKPRVVQKMYKLVMQANAGMADVLLACSEDASRVFGRYAVQAKIINNSIDFDVFKYNESSRAAIRVAYSIPADSTVFLHVGRMENASKNQEFLLRVFSAYQERDNRAFLFLVGDGPRRHYLEGFASQLGVSANVIFVGTTSSVQDYYSAADMFLFPSIHEGLGIALVEAQASGLPCIVSDRVPARAKYTDNVAHVPIDSGVDPWLDAIVALLGKERASLTEDEVAASGFSAINSNAILASALGLDMATNKQGVMYDGKKS